MKLHSTALLRSTIGVIWLVVLMTLWSELSVPFKAFLTGLATHHWIGKSVISAVAFIVFYFIFSRARESGDVLKGARAVAWSVVLGGLTIFAFYVWHFING